LPLPIPPLSPSTNLSLSGNMELRDIPPKPSRTSIPSSMPYKMPTCPFQPFGFTNSPPRTTTGTLPPPTPVLINWMPSRKPTSNLTKITLNYQELQFCRFESDRWLLYFHQLLIKAVSQSFQTGSSPCSLSILATSQALRLSLTSN